MRPNESKEWYQVILEPKGASTSYYRHEFELNLSFESIERRFLVPYRRGQPMVIKGRTITTEDLKRIRIFKSKQEIGSLDSVWGQEEVTQEFITGLPGNEIETAPLPKQELTPPTDAREVFVVHGRNGKARQAIFAFLRSIGLHPLEWSEAVQSTGKPMPYIGEILDVAFSRAHAVVVLLTPDDEARLIGALRGRTEPPHEINLIGQARPNVLFEAGMAMGRNENRTIMVELGTLRPFSDIAGRHVIRLDNTTQRRQELAQRLELAGCPVNLNGIDWHSAGDFEEALDLTLQTSPESAAVVVDQSNNAAIPHLPEESKRLLIEAATANGAVLNLSQRGENPRMKAARDHAVSELAKQGLVKDGSGMGRVFEVTDKGFKVADSLGDS